MWNDAYHLIVRSHPGICSTNMGEVIQFVSKAERERARLIREARAIYDSIFPPADLVSATPRSSWRKADGLIFPAAALPPPPLQRDLRQNRHRDLFRRDGAEIEARRRLDAVDRNCIDAGRNQFLA
jgi:hypothetical protein